MGGRRRLYMWLSSIGAVLPRRWKRNAAMTGVSCLYPAAAWLPVLLLVFRRASSLSLSRSRLHHLGRRVADLPIHHLSRDAATSASAASYPSVPPSLLTAPQPHRLSPLQGLLVLKSPAVVGVVMSEPVMTSQMICFILCQDERVFFDRPQLSSSFHRKLRLILALPPLEQAGGECRVSMRPCMGNIPMPSRTLGQNVFSSSAIITLVCLKRVVGRTGDQKHASASE